MPERSHTRSKFLKEIFFGFATVVVLLLAKTIFEQTRPGHVVEDVTYEYLIWTRAWFDRDELPVAIVNISQFAGGKYGQVTPRDKLEDLVSALAEQDPAAIAIDEDFSPDQTGWVDDDDPAFFDFCLKTRKSVPIFLGVYKGMKGGSDAWLGLPKYKDMAVSIVRRKGLTKRMPLWVQSIGVPEKLPSLAAALATTYRNTVAEPNWLKSITNRTSDKQAGSQERLKDIRGDEFDVADSLVNYGRLEEMQHATLPTINAEFIRKSESMFRGKLVIIGAANDSADTSIAPGQTEPVSGIFLHESAAYSWTRAPLYEFRESFRWTLDLLLSGLIVISIPLMRFCNDKGHQGVCSKEWQGRLIWILFVAVVFAGPFLIIEWGITWFDFLLVAFAFLLHPKVDEKLKKTWLKLFPRTAGRDGQKHA